MHFPAIRKVCVVGAGTMGSGIAAHLANLGFAVTLLDVTQQAAIEGLDRAKAAKPPTFYVPDRAVDIRLGNIDDHLDWAAEADWVCEAIVENIDAKRVLFARLDEYLRADAMVTTNTSGLPIELLAEDRSATFRRKFLGTHFFNPPRYLKLLELIPTEETSLEVVEHMRQFLEREVARRVVLAKDTPGFIANRFGMWSMFHAIHTAERLHLSVEQVDAITGPFLGRPKSGSFRLNDIVGLDVMRDIASNLRERCSEDPFRKTLELPDSLLALLGRGWIGEKVGRGYYRREGRDLLALDLGTMAYRDAREVDIPSIRDLGSLPLGERISKALELHDEAGEFLRNYLPPVLQYATYLKERVSHSVLDFDRVMMWGFGWHVGPFGLMDEIGYSKEPNYKEDTQRAFDGRYVHIKTDPEFRTVHDYPVIDSQRTYRLRDLGDGISAVCTTTKMGVITPALVEDLIALVERHRLDRFVLTSEARSFSVGFDLSLFLKAIGDAQFDEIDSWLVRLQMLGEMLESRTCVAAIYGHCLGGGFEIATSCPVVVAQAECQIGLPEAKVGLLPAGRGSTLLRLRNSNSSRRAAEIALTLAEGVASTSADHARVLGYLRSSDITCYHPDRLLTVAKEAVHGASPSPRPEWRQNEGPLSGVIDRMLDEAKARGRLTPYDRTIGEHIQTIFARSGSYKDSLTKERALFLDLCRRSMTAARIKHMIENGKPLRN